MSAELMPDTVIRRQWIEPSGQAYDLTSPQALHIAAGVLAEMESDAQSVGYDAFLRNLDATKQRDPQTGLTSALLTEATDPARVHTAVLIGGFGMRWREVVLLAEYWRRMHKALGRHINVLAFDLPGPPGETKLSAQERSILNAGDMTPFGYKLLQIAEERCMPSSISLLSYSYGNLLGAAMIPLAAQRGLQISSFVAGALPNPKHGVRLRRTVDFALEALISGGKYPAGTPSIFTYKPPGKRSDISGILKQAPALQRRIANHNAHESLAEARRMAPNMRLILGWGTHDRIGRNSEMLDLLSSLGALSGGELIGVAYEGLHHAWGRHLPLLGEMAVISTKGISSLTG